MTNLRQVMQLRRVRNECRESLTHSTDYISRWRQLRWWLSRPRLECYLFYDGRRPIGYGALKPDWRCDACGFDPSGGPLGWHVMHPAYWMTHGLIRAYRGRGLSRMQVGIMTELAYRQPDVEVWIDVWADNHGLRADIRSGYELVSEEDREGRRLLIMRHNRDRALRIDEQRLLGSA